MVEVTVYNKKFIIEQDLDFGVVENFIDAESYQRIQPFRVTYKPSHVFDADKSVNWNRQEVDIRNKQNIDARNRCLAEKNECCKILNEALHQYVAAELNRPSIPFGSIMSLYAYLRDNFDHEWYKYLDETLVLIRIMNGDEK